MNKSKLIELIVQKLPHPQQIEDWNLSLVEEIQFTWRGQRFAVRQKSLRVEEIQDSFRAGSNIAIILEGLLTS